MKTLFPFFQKCLYHVGCFVLAFLLFALAAKPVVNSFQAHAAPLSFGGLPDVPLALPDTTGSYDLDRLAHAVAFAETGHCRDGTAIKRRNCFGLMVWDKNGNRSPRYFKTQEDSFKEFKRVWSAYYGKFPDQHLAAKWTGNDHPATWLKNVTAYYNGQITL